MKEKIFSYANMHAKSQTETADFPKSFQGQSFAKMNFSLMTIFRGKGSGCEGGTNYHELSKAYHHPSNSWVRKRKVKAQWRWWKQFMLLRARGAKWDLFNLVHKLIYFFPFFFWVLLLLGGPGVGNVGQQEGYHLVAIFGHPRIS